MKDRPEVYGDLYARTLVVSDGEQTLAIVTCDVGTFFFDFINRVLPSIEKATGIPAGNIVICTTQTHNAPGVDGRRMSAESKTWLVERLTSLVKEANDALQPATLEYGRAGAQIGYNCRLMRNGQVVMEANPDGAIVPWVDVLSAHAADDKRIGVLFSHAAHPVIVHNSSQAIGPDFPGFAVDHLRRLLKTQGEPEGILMFAQAACGNINGHPLRGGIPAANAAGLSLAVDTRQALAEDKEITPGAVRARSVTLQLPIQDPPSVAECEAVLKEQPENRRYQGLLAIAQKIAAGEPAPTLPFPMRALAVGDDLCFMTFVGEMFAEYQLFVDEVSPFKHTFVFIHANGRNGYMATKQDYDLGSRAGYEAWGLPVRGKPWMPPHPSSEETIRKAVVKLLKDLKGE